MSVEYTCNACGNVMTFSDEEEGSGAICEACFSDDIEFSGESDFDFENDYY